MRLRKLTLCNVRRFANRTVELGPFGDGLTTITAENESGKSTFFDALHALFFFDYGANRKELRSLQPYSGGAMSIAAEVDVADESYRIEKVFNLRKPGSSATITSLSTGMVLKQADDAEAWIQTNILNTRKGPVGLLWVRQGMVGVDPDGKGEGIDARRDVMSSVRGQIDAVTGGRRMDQIVQHCKQELDTISTKQGKPKAGSAWKDAEDRVAALQETRETLKRSVAVLADDLVMKKRVTARLRALQDPMLRSERQAAIKSSHEQLLHARDYAQKVSTAQKDLQLLINKADGFERQIKEITAARDNRERLMRAVAEQQKVLAKAAEAKHAAKIAADALQKQIAEADQTQRQLADKVNRARQMEKSTAKRQRLAALQALLQDAHPLMEKLGHLDAILLDVEVTRSDLQQLVDLERRRDMAIEKRKVHFASFVLSADKALATRDGVDVPSDVPHIIDQTMEIALPGFGALQLNPAEGSGTGIEDPDQLLRDLNRLLASMAMDSVKAARHAYETRQKALQDKQTLLAQIKGLAPDGVEALEQERRRLCQDLDVAADAEIQPVPLQGGETSPSSEELEAALTQARAQLDGLRIEETRLRDAFTQTVGGLAAEEGSLQRMQAELSEQPALDGEAQAMADLVKDQSAIQHAIADANSVLEVLRGEAPDLSVAEAGYKRAQKAEEEDQKEIALQDRELARLNGAIQIQSDGAVEEKLAEVIGKLERAAQRAQQFSNHAKALALLIDHLEAARAEAQETYFEPIRKELLPLLQQLHGGIDFELDADKLLVETITRHGVTDKVDALSGGAYEQIAILTRLAFARLFAQQGSHVPIILDDALVHTDDERISTMFNMLAQMANDQQIIVLSCRTRAFSDLGGDRAFIQQLERLDG